MKAVFLAGLFVSGLTALGDLKEFNKEFAKGWDSQPSDVNLPKIDISLSEEQLAALNSDVDTVELPKIEIGLAEDNSFELPKIEISLTAENSIELPKIEISLTEDNSIELPKIEISLTEEQLSQMSTGDNTVNLPKIEISIPTYAWDTEFTSEDLKFLDLKSLFEIWKTEFEQSYSGVEEEADRYLNFLDSVYTIARENSKGHSYKLALNQFGAMTTEEFQDYVGLGKGRPEFLPEQPQDLNTGDSDLENPSEVNWVKEGKVTPVKNQGSCGSCWAFSSTGALECQYAIKHNKLNSLSEQQLVDCSGSYGNYGCNGGWWYNAFDYVKDVGGLCSESEYRYTATDGTCKESSCGTKYNPISGYTSVSKDSESALESAVAKGCVSIGVEADQYAWQYYSSGVLTGTCGANVDHGVLAVGYNNDESTKYWIVKNSWGASWGQNGYVYVCKECSKNGKDGECGILMYDAYPNSS